MTQLLSSPITRRGVRPGVFSLRAGACHNAATTLTHVEVDMSVDIVIEVDNKPGVLASIAAAISDAGVNLAAATCIGRGETAELHILVPHAEPVRHALALTHQAVITREHEVVVAEVHDRPGELADLARRIAEAGINVDTIYVATGNRVVFGADDIAGLRAALGVN